MVCNITLFYCRVSEAIQMDAGAAHYGYEAALIACSKVINQDGSLGMAHTMPGAAGVSVFFQSHIQYLIALQVLDVALQGR